jgi:hypothetical protein
MEHLPLDARSVVDELRSAPRPTSALGPRTWVPSQSFDSLVLDADRPPVHLNDHLNWLHQNWNLQAAIAPPPGGGLKGFVKRTIHRAVVAVLRPYLNQVQDCIGVTVRTLDVIARRVDEQASTQLRTVGAVRSDLVDFAHHVDERIDGALG